MALLLKTVQASRGPRWIADAFRLFARRPFAFTSLFAIYLFAAMLVAQVPLRLCGSARNTPTDFGNR